MSTPVAPIFPPRLQPFGARLEVDLSGTGQATNLATVPQLSAWASTGQFGAYADTGVTGAYAMASLESEAGRSFGRQTLTAANALGFQFRLNPNSVVSGSAMQAGAGMPCVAVTAVRIYFVARVTVAAGGTRPVRLQYRFADAAGVWLAATVLVTFTAASGVWTACDTTIPVPSGAAFLTWNYNASTATNVAVGDSFDLADILVGTDGYTGPYFDGDSPDATWIGLPNASKSALGVRSIGCDPTAVDYLTLTGLSLTWGRSSVQDQPATGTCTFELAAPVDDRWQRDLTPGTPVTVFASVQVGIAGQPVDYAVDGGFESTPLSARAWSPATVQFTAGHTGARAIAVTNLNIGTEFVSLHIPPAPFSADPNAWAAIPQLTPDSTWTIRAWVLTPLAWAVDMILRRFATPNDRNPTGGLGQPIPVADGWQQAELTVSGWADWIGGWPGITFRLSDPTPWMGWPGAWSDQSVTWYRLGTLQVDDIEIIGPEQAIVEEQIFSGRVTDLSAAWEGAPTERPVRVNLTAVDWSADLENQLIGAAGYPEEGLTARLARMVAELVTPVPTTIDNWDGAGWVLTSREAESPAGAMSLLSEAATSTDLVLWPTWQPITGFYLWFENPTGRSALRLLILDSSGGVGGSTDPIGKEANSRLGGVRVWQQAPPPANDTVDADYSNWPVTDAATQQNINTSTWTGGNRWVFLWANRRNFGGANTRPNVLPISPSVLVNGYECRAVYSTIAIANAATRTQIRYMAGNPDYASPWTATGGNTADVITTAQFQADPGAYLDPTPWDDGAGNTYMVISNKVVLPDNSLLTGTRPDLVPGIVLDYEVADGRPPSQTQTFLSNCAADVRGAGKQLYVYTNALNAPSQVNTGLDATNLSAVLATVDFLGVFIPTVDAQSNYDAQIALFTAPIDWSKIVLTFQIGSGDTLSPIGNAIFANTLLRSGTANTPTKVMFWRSGAVAGSADSNLRISTVLFGASGGAIRIVGTGRPSDGVLLSACDIDRGPVQFQADVSDVVTRVEVGWNLPVTVDGEPGYEDRTATVIDQAAEAAWGQRGVQISTQLTSAANAELVATRTLNRSRAQGWRADGLAWDTRLANTVNERRAALTLLNGATRPGLPIVFENLPDWAPEDAAGVYLEGGTYSYESGRWQMSFTVSPSGAAGFGVRWNQLNPGWTWAQFDPAVLWWHLATATTQALSDQHTQQVAAHAATYLVKEE